MKHPDYFKTVAFTGHRPEGLPWSSDDHAARAFRHHLKNTLEELIATGCVNFLSGAARGFDTIAAETVLELRELYPWVELTVVLPCDDQAEKWDEEDRPRWERLLERADHVLHLGSAYDKGCMFRRNRYLVDHASLLVAAYDGHSAGGTAMTLAYAAEKEKTVIRLSLGGSAAKTEPLPEPIREIA